MNANVTIEQLIDSWDGEQVLSRHDAATGAWMFAAIHSTRLGPAGGGTRMRVYDTPAAGLLDAMDLAQGMTRKMATAALPVGGGKSVVAVPQALHGDERRRVLEQYASMVNAMDGNFITGPDMNIDLQDLNCMRGKSPYILGTELGVIDGRSVSHATALGTLHGVRACVREAFGNGDLDGLLVLVQGVGEVGGILVDLLIAEGARVAISDINPSRIAPVKNRHPSVALVDPEQVLGYECDVYAPCAMGRVIGPEDVGKVRAKVVAGCANIQLRSPDETSASLRSAGIVYGPDYVVNGGGAIHCFGGEFFGWSGAKLLEQTSRIENRLANIFEIANAENIGTQSAADRLADQVVREGVSPS